MRPKKKRSIGLKHCEQKSFHRLLSFSDCNHFLNWKVTCLAVWMLAHSTSFSKALHQTLESASRIQRFVKCIQIVLPCLSLLKLFPDLESAPPIHWLCEKARVSVIVLNMFDQRMRVRSHPTCACFGYRYLLICSRWFIFIKLCVALMLQCAFWCQQEPCSFFAITRLILFHERRFYMFLSHCGFCMLTVIFFVLAAPDLGTVIISAVPNFRRCSYRTPSKWSLLEKLTLLPLIELHVGFWVNCCKMSTPRKKRCRVACSRCIGAVPLVSLHLLG